MPLPPPPPWVPWHLLLKLCISPPPPPPLCHVYPQVRRGAGGHEFHAYPVSQHTPPQPFGPTNRPVLPPSAHQRALFRRRPVQVEWACLVGANPTGLWTAEPSPSARHPTVGPGKRAPPRQPFSKATRKGPTYLPRQPFSKAIATALRLRIKIPKGRPLSLHHHPPPRHPTSTRSPLLTRPPDFSLRSCSLPRHGRRRRFVSSASHRQRLSWSGDSAWAPSPSCPSDSGRGDGRDHRWSRLSPSCREREKWSRVVTVVS